MEQVEQVKVQSFQLGAVTTPVYVHGFSNEQVATIKEGKAGLDARNLAEEPVTLEEFKTIVVPWNRIHRVEQFILHIEKPKVAKTPRAKKIVVPKVKKLTKKAIKEKLDSIIGKKMFGAEVTEEEEAFYNEQVELAKGDL